ncbi:MAG: AtpZ/AtpI family protein [Patescibacteria group bacterium]|nr:AtpZ/AtpI family protein [Patescibacteria group bacterium]
MSLVKKRILQLNKENKFEAVEKEVNVEEETDEQRTRFFSLFTSSTELGFVIALPIAGGALLGTYLDRIFNMSPKLTLSLIFAGTLIGLVNIYYLFRESEKEGAVSKKHLDKQQKGKKQHA